MGVTCSIKEIRNAYKILISESEGKRQCGRTRDG
jgi:hypothetical protein